MHFVDELRLHEINVLQYVQGTLHPLGSLFIAGCHVGDPRYPYIYFSFFLSMFGDQLAFKSLWAVVIGEWLNTLFKWIVNDHRPYWWVNEYLLSHQKVELKQFDVTCETGPGNPSGHMMVTTCVWFVVYKQLMKSKFLNTTVRKITVLTAMIFWLLVIAFGRMYISAHFPDQCVFGLVAGLFTGALVDHFVDINHLKTRHHFVVSKIIVLSLFGTYALLNAFSSQDANWSVKLAQKWCFDIQYVKPDTTPFFVLWRTAATAIGTGVAFIFIRKRFLRVDRCSRSLLTNFVIGAVSAVSISMFLEMTRVKVSSLTSLNLVYTVCFLQYLFMPVIGYSVVCILKSAIKPKHKEDE